MQATRENLDISATVEIPGPNHEPGKKPFWVGLAMLALVAIAAVLWVFLTLQARETEFEAMVVASRNGGEPCGSCRQVLSEFGLDTRISIVDGKGSPAQETTVRELLPYAFTSEDLTQNKD